MKRTLIAILTAAMIMAMCMPAYASYKQAYKTNVIDLPQGKFVTAVPFTTKYKDRTDTSTDTFDMYRIKIAENGYVKIRTGVSGEVSIFKSFVKNTDIDTQQSLMEVGGRTNNYVVLPRGTYYLHANEKTRLRWMFYPVANATNYCRANAKSLSSSKDATCLFPYSREHSQYFRIKVTSQRTCNFVLTRMDTDPDTDMVEYAVLNARGKLVAQPSPGGTTCSKTLPEGTYYIKVYRNMDGEDDDYYTGRLAKIRWQ